MRVFVVEEEMSRRAIIKSLGNFLVDVGTGVRTVGRFGLRGVVAVGCSCGSAVGFHTVS